MKMNPKPWILLIGVILLVFCAFAGIASAADIYVPDDYLKIQWAVDNASAGDTIIVRDGTYLENVVVNKTINLIGDDKNTTVIDGQGIGDVVHVSADGITITGLTITNSGNNVAGEDKDAGIDIYSNYNIISGNIITNNNLYGIRLWGTNNNIIVDNTVSNNNGCGIDLGYSSNNNTITNNNVSNNGNNGIVLLEHCNNNTILNNNVSNNGNDGIATDYPCNNNTMIGNIVSNNEEYGMNIPSGSNILRNNLMSDNLYNFYTRSSDLNVDTSNFVDDKPIYYLVGASNAIINSFSNAGTVYCFNCNNVTVKDLVLTNNAHGVYFYETTNSKIQSNNISNNENAICLYYSNSNIITDNSVSKNQCSIDLYYSSSNNISNNIARDNTVCIDLSYSNNNIITGNIFNNSNTGVYSLAIGMSHSDNNLITNNKVRNNKYCAHIFYSDDNKIYLNNFLDNSEIFRYYYDSTNIWNSTSPITYTYNGTTYTNYLGNYWDDYSDTDANGDGIWDNPYTINGDKDWYPLKERFENYVVDELLDVPFFSQRDPAWKDKKLDHSPYSIGQYGCALTSAAMVANYFGYDTDPGRLNTSLTEVGGLDSSGDLYWAKVEEISGGTVTWIESVGATWSRIDQELENENPVISSVDCSLGTHFIVLIGKSGSDYYFLDPYDQTEKFNQWPNGAHGEYSLKNLKIYHGIAQKPAKPVLTSPLEITPKEVYYVGDTLTANFTITNRGTESITFDVLVVGGRDPAGEVVDFDKAYDITLTPGDSYNYQGSLTLPDKPGIYHFFCAYHTEEHMPGEDDYNWNTNIDVEINGEIVEDFNEAKRYRETDIVVYEEGYIGPAPPPAVWEKIEGPWDSWPVSLWGNWKEPLEIAVNPNNPDEIYVSAILRCSHWGENTGGKLYKSTDGGNSWNPINQGLPGMTEYYWPVRAIAIAPSNPDIIYVGTSALNPYSFPCGATGIYKSTNGGSEWAAISGPGKYYDISSLAVDPTNPDIVYIGTVGGGIWRTTDGGASYEKIWNEPINKETLLDVISLAISPANSNIVYAAAYNFDPLNTMGWSGILIPNRLIKSEDGGNTWERLRIGILTAAPKIEDIVVDDKNADIVYVISGAFDVYKSTDGGKNWYDASGSSGTDPLPNPLSIGPTVGRANSIAMDPQFSNGIYAARRGEGAYLSPNSGKNWFPIGLQEGHWLKNLVFANNADTRVIYAASTELFKLDISNSVIIVREHSPIELRVYDSQGRVTGLVNGEVSEEIPNSAYDDESKTILIFNSTDIYYCQVVGSNDGTYGLEITSENFEKPHV